MEYDDRVLTVEFEFAVFDMELKLFTVVFIPPPPTPSTVFKFTTVCCLSLNTTWPPTDVGVVLWLPLAVAIVAVAGGAI